MLCKMQGCVGQSMSEELGSELLKMPTIFHEKNRHRGEILGCAHTVACYFEANF